MTYYESTVLFFHSFLYLIREKFFLYTFFVVIPSLLPYLYKFHEFKVRISSQLLTYRS